MNRPARFTTVDLRRALRAAQKFGQEYVVEIAPDGTIRIVRDPGRKSSLGLVEPIEEVVF